MILGSIPLKDIVPGIKVRSMITGAKGMISEVSYEKIDIDKLGWIIINWNNGNITSQPYFDPDWGDNQAFDHIEIIGEL